MTRILLLIIGVSITMHCSMVAAEEYEPEDLIKYRKHSMNAIKHHNNAIRMILKGKVSQEDLNMHVKALGKLIKRVDNWFPEGSDFGETNAKDAIWDKPAKFRKANEDAVAAFKTFKAVIADGDRAASAKAMKKFGKASCGSCHKKFKKKDD